MIDVDFSRLEVVLVFIAVTGAWISGYLLGYLRGRR